MEIKILQVFYGKDGLPYKDKDRQVHFPIAGTGFLGASNTTKIKFYYDELDNLDETTWVAVSKLPNGKVGSRVLESYLDEELNEHYALLELDNYYTQYKGDVFISLQGYQGGVDFDYDEENSQYEIHGTPTIAATGSIKFTINYANQFVGSGETDNINFQRILAALGTKLGMRAYSEHVEELPSEGSPDVFYVVNDDPNNPNLANIYVWNENTRHYIWVGDNTLDLGNYYTKEQGEQFESDVNEDISLFKNEIETTLENVSSGSPKGVYATLSDLESAYPTGTDGIFVVNANGHWYYWNGTAWTDGGLYLSDANYDKLLEMFSSPFVSLSNRPSYMKGIIGFKPKNESITAYGYRIRYYGYKDSSYYLYLRIEYRTSSTEDTWANYGSDISITLANAPTEDRITILSTTNIDLIYIPSLMQPQNLTQLSPAVEITDNSNDFFIQSIYLNCETKAQLVQLENEVDADKTFVSPFVDYSHTPSYLKGIVGFKFKKEGVSADGYRIRYWGFNDDYYLFLYIEALVSGNWVNYSNIEIPTSSAPENQNGIICLKNNDFEVMLAPSLLPSQHSISLATGVEVIDNSNTFFYQNVVSVLSIDLSGIETQLSLVDTPFKSEIPNSMRGIIAFQLYSDVTLQLENYTKFRIAQMYFGHSSLYLHISLQGYRNNAWEYFDSVTIEQPYTPASDVIIVNSSYKRMKVVVIPSLMGNIELSSCAYELKVTAINRFISNLQEQIDNQNLINQYEDFAIMDHPKHIVVVDANGNGDYTTIGAAYAAITDSSYENQYEIQVLPGTYNEYNLVPPIFTHTHGLHPDTVIVTGVGISEKELSIFDLIHTCKLSNMTIIANAVLNDNGTATNQNRYCVHFDTGDTNRIAICHNLKLLKVYNATSENPYGDNVRNRAWVSTWSRYVVGMGTGHATTRIDFDSCQFINGEFVSHTNPNTDTNSNGYVNIRNCVFTNSFITLNALQDGDTYSTQGKYVCNIENCDFEVSRVMNSKNLVLGFWGNKKAWTITGGRNKNLTVGFIQQGSGDGDAYECLNTTESGYINMASGIASQKGRWVDVYGNIANNPTKEELFGIALESKSANNALPTKCWVGNAYPYGESDGLYGIVNGIPSQSASNKVFRIINGTMYRL